jgi:lysophospholipase L1-like esterase/peptidoglycan/xylan/chitin deacetylase (PgdA/CDA1 family)
MRFLTPISAQRWRHASFAACLPALFVPVSQAAPGSTHWIGSWATSQQLPEAQNSLPVEDLRDATLRQIVHLSIGGQQLRVHLSNRFGTAPLHFAAVHIARPTLPVSSGITVATDTVLTFSGKTDVTVPAGADYVSDPVAFPVAPLSDLAISVHIDAPPANQTGHPGSHATSYIVHGNRLSAGDLPEAKKLEHWYFLAGVDVNAPPQAAAIVTLGDSITDGHGATTDGNDRWPDLLAKRLQSDSGKKEFAVLNQGIGGNRLLLDGLGPNALARFDHDVLAQPGVRYVIVLEGVNDIGMLARTREVPAAEHESMVKNIIAAYGQILSRAHPHGIQVIGTTILPFADSAFYHPSPATEADRQAINAWIRGPDHFDAFVDFDEVTRDPQRPDHLLPAFDSGDHLHPSPAGFAAMADAVPFSLFDNAAGQAGSPLKIALTFDDLPAHGSLPQGTTREEIARKILAALHDAGAPPVYGFVNGEALEREPGSDAIFRAWRAAGQPLGNHTWSHMNLAQHSLTEFGADATRMEPVLRQQMKDEDWHWFRFPYLSEGDTPEKENGVRAFLAQHGYRIAAVTMSFGDYQWTEPYARCKAKGDTRAIEALKSSYLAAADETIGYSRGLSQKLYGRDIPYVLLMHIGALDAEVLPQLLQLYRSRGFQFVTLAEAQSDPFYRESLDPRLPAAPDTLEEKMAERGLPLPARAPLGALLDVVCR